MPDAGAAISPGNWRVLTPLDELPRYYVGAAAAQGRIFMIGGLSDGPEESAVHAYDVAGDSWERLADLPMPVPMPNVAAVGERLFVLGGMAVNEAFEYDFEQDAWLEIAPLPVNTAPGGAAVGVQGDTVFLAGGAIPGLSANLLNTGVRVNGFYAYDTVADTWERLVRLPIAVGYSMGAVIDGEFWVIGGSDNTERTARVNAYDIEAGTWSDKPLLPISLSSAAAGVLQGRLYVTGGIASSSGVISSVSYVFDVTNDSWRPVRAIPTPRFGMGAAVLDDELYVGLGIKGESPSEFVAVGDLEVFNPE
jgi:N-acetylneuraminic acid mutarotase